MKISIFINHPVPSSLKTVHRTVFLTLRLSRVRLSYFLHKITKRPNRWLSLLLLAMGYEKDIFAGFAYEFELLHKSRRKPCISSATCCGISSTRSVVYHQAAGNAR